MTSPAAAAESFHVLLVGIDAYPARPLRGCVNDVDAVQRTLIERAGVPRERILRLASPHRGASGAAPEAAGRPATLANLRDAFAELVRRAQEGDRVFVYYAGHGTRVEIECNGQRSFHEALVPVDFDRGPGEGLLYDYELNGILGELTAKTRAVTLVLDCCHAAGATRSELTARGLDLRELGWSWPLHVDATRSGPAPTVDDCHVITACLGHERAHEGAGEDGEVHGLLTRALVRALEDVPDDELTTVPWSRIWQRMRADVEHRNPHQHLWMAGHAGRAVLAGVPVAVAADPGFAVRPGGGDRYEIDAGTLASVTETALVAVYGARPALLPPVGSVEDMEARLGVVRVTEAERSRATGAAIGAPFAVPPGARGRIVAPGRAARLRCAIVPPHPAVEAQLAASPLLEVVPPERARVRLERAPAGGGAAERWVLTDDVHGIDPGRELCALAAHELERARALLEHYFSYALPLRLAEAAVDLPGALRLAVLVSPRRLAPADAVRALLSEARTPAGSSAYDLTEDDGVAFRVRNGSTELLHVTLVNAAASGRVQVLDEQSVEAGRAHTFWAGNQIGEPFYMAVPRGRRGCVDRLIAIGTTAHRDLRHLARDLTFAETVGRPRDFLRAIGDRPAALERWTATQVILRTAARGA